MYGREDDIIYLHGAMASRLLNELEKGFDVCLSIAKVNALVLARSAFSHSLNYESVVIFGKGKLVQEKDKNHALKVISDNLLKVRWDEVRLPNKKELSATKVIAISIDEITGKVRDEGVIDNKEDLDLPIWAGIVPIEQKFGKPIKADGLSDDLKIPNSVRKLYQ
jgi:nitroimidazol reductase NimA-like FMN-containing flavoprotein (pyridoxamine 5'-phosphate oxidase superfamily)